MNPRVTVSRTIPEFFICVFFVLLFNLSWADNNPDLDKIKRFAESGDIEAQYLLGSIYYYGEVIKIVKDIDYKGEPVQRDWKEAFRWFKKPAEQGHVYSQFRMGEIYEAQFQQGTIFERGQMLPQDGEEAVRWYHKAAIQGHKPSRDRMTYLMRSWKIELKPAKNVPATDLNDLAKLAEQGDMDAQYQLGFNYAKGKGVPQDAQKASTLFYKAAVQGHPEAQHNIGMLYYKGYGVKQNSYKAIEWFSKASVQGNSDSSYMMGLINMRGTGVPKDIKKGSEFLHKAAQQGHPKGQNYLGYCYATGSCSSTPINLEKAIEWFSKAASQGDREAMDNLTAAEYEQTMAKSSFKKARSGFSPGGFKSTDMKDIWTAAAAIAGTLWFASEIENVTNNQSKSENAYTKPSEGCTPEYINGRLIYCYNESVEGIDAECGASLLDNDVAACESAVQWEMEHGVPESYWWCDKKTHFVSPDKSSVIEKICQ